MMSVESFRMYVCPQCKGQLGVEATALTCPACLRAYPILDGIPDFLADDPAQSRDPVLRSVERIDRMARFYESKWWYPLVLNVYGGWHCTTFAELVDIIRKIMRPVRGLILDVACGPGTYGRRVAAEGNTIYGIDISLGMLRQGAAYAAQEKIANIHFSRNRVEALPFADQTFDAAICSGSLHLFPDPAQALHEINRTMKPAAPLAVMTFTPGDKGLFKHAWARKRVQTRGFHLFTLHEMERLLLGSGFVDFQPKKFGSVLTFSARKRTDN
ncbi:MAG: hypothetical protein CO064_08430 [Anaerolineae bacterium CG_4_9_14_0_8_um_filter_58_9]|nr:MAG: hypothetical protein CO064_08430 [Anaerolineae bacterium CG_4_9_14_0_8_um_filter_58_9]